MKLVEMDDVKEIVFYQAHKRLSKDLLDFLLKHLRVANGSGLPSDWDAFLPVVEKMEEHHQSRIRHLEAYFLKLRPEWNEYTTILGIMMKVYQEASATPIAFEFQLKHVENCWKSRDYPLSWVNVNKTRKVKIPSIFYIFPPDLWNRV